MSASKNKKSALEIIVDIILWFSLLLVLAYSLITLKNEYSAAFEKAVDKSSEEVYENFREKAYDYFEKENHVSNSASLTIGNIKEQNSLEVLSVSDNWIKVSEPDDDSDKTTRWVEFNATGVYTVDMSVSEFIIDDYNNFVMVRLKTPQLNHIALSADPKVYLYKYKKELFKVNGDYDSGVVKLLDDRAEALSELTNQLENNEDNFMLAKQSAEKLIRTFIINANPEISLKDSDIQIEFF